MSISYLKHQIERIKRAIEEEKAKIADSRKDITSTRLNKSRRAEHYSYYINALSSRTVKTDKREARKKEWEEFSRVIEREKETIASCSDRIKKHREDLKRSREDLKNHWANKK